MAKSRPVNRVRAMAIKIQLQVQKRAGTGLQNCAVFLAARVKEELSVPASRKRVVSSIGNIRYRATTRAIPGAPPRKLSGKLRQSVAWQLVTTRRAVVGTNARSARGFDYGRHHETRTGHAFLVPTAHRYRAELRRIMGRSLATRVL